MTLQKPVATAGSAADEIDRLEDILSVRLVWIGVARSGRFLTHPLNVPTLRTEGVGMRAPVFSQRGVSTWATFKCVVD